MENEDATISKKSPFGEEQLSIPFRLFILFYLLLLEPKSSMVNLASIKLIE